MIPLRLLGLGAAAFLVGGCTQPAPVVHVTVIMQQPPAQPPQAKVEQASMPTTINRPLPDDRKWGDPLPWRKDGEVYQVEVCRGRVGAFFHGCFSYGPSVSEGADCLPVMAQAEIDFPGEEYGCTRVYRSDLTPAMGLPLDQT